MLSFNLSKEDVLEVHFVIGEHLFISRCSNKDGAINYVKVEFDITNGFLI